MCTLQVVNGDCYQIRLLIDRPRCTGTMLTPCITDKFHVYFMFLQVVGGDRCPIVDTYWQTETGAHVLAPIPGVWPAKPGSATLPFFGVQPAMVNEQVRSSRRQHKLRTVCCQIATQECLSSLLPYQPCPLFAVVQYITAQENRREQAATQHVG